MRRWRIRFLLILCVFVMMLCLRNFHSLFLYRFDTNRVQQNPLQMFKLRELIYGCHNKGIAHISGTGCQKILIKEIAVTFHKQRHQHDYRSGVPFAERVYLPDTGKQPGQRRDKFLTGALIPVIVLNHGKGGAQIAVNIVIVGIPHAAPTEKPLRLFNIHNPILACPIVNVAK